MSDLRKKIHNIVIPYSGVTINSPMIDNIIDAFIESLPEKLNEEEKGRLKGNLIYACHKAIRPRHAGLRSRMADPVYAGSLNEGRSADNITSQGMGRVHGSGKD